MRTKYKNMLDDFSLYGIELSDRQLEQFNTYYELLIKWNEVMNLTAITDFDDVCKLHFVDSISACQYFDFSSKDYSLVDIGTGAGFPGIPLKIVFPNLHITLLDSLNKRLNFLNEVIDTLGLNETGSIKTLHGRAEDYSQPKEGSLRETFDIAVSRAVANMSTLSEYCLPYVKVGGVFIAYKSDKIREEVSALGSAAKILGAEPVQVREFTLPGTEYHRALAVLHKKKQTPAKYPRKAGLPAKEPLH